MCIPSACRSRIISGILLCFLKDRFFKCCQESDLLFQTLNPSLVPNQTFPLVSSSIAVVKLSARLLYFFGSCRKNSKLFCFKFIEFISPDSVETQSVLNLSRNKPFKLLSDKERLLFSSCK